jgi:SAM-dependent methyltransferase
MKQPKDVGADFDEYARRWRKDDYSLESGGNAAGVVVDPTRDHLVQRPGDEWGDVAPLRRAYSDLVRTLVKPGGRVNVVEIGAGGGRSTAVMLDVLGERAGDYHVVDVSPVFVEVLKQRIDPPPVIHVVEDVDLSPLPDDHFDLCLAQSSWSHINLYDQYRYLRELRHVLRPGAVVYVSGQFLLGLGNDWTWNRFVRRVNQLEHGVRGVFHEFTSVAALAEMLTRLGYDIACISTAGFVARRGVGSEGTRPSLGGPISFPFNPNPYDFLARGSAELIQLPTAAPTKSSSANTLHMRTRRVAKRVPGLRPLVLRLRARRRRRTRSVTPAARTREEPGPAAPADATRWDRQSVLGERFTPRTLADFVDPTPAITWETVNPHAEASADDILAELLVESKWRHHHEIPELRHRGHLYRGYVERVDALLEMLDAALAAAGVDIADTRFLDVGAAEGYVVNHLIAGGAVDVDAIELNASNIERMWKVRAYKGIASGRIGRLDLERADWSRALGRTYDVVLALGVIYHMENPMLFARNVSAACERFAIVESDTPVFKANQRFRGYGNMYLHRDQVTLAPGDVRYFTEMRPDRQALAEMLLEAGFVDVQVIPPATTKPSPFYTDGKKTVMLARR